MKPGKNAPGMGAPALLANEPQVVLMKDFVEVLANLYCGTLPSYIAARNEESGVIGEVGSGHSNPRNGN